MENAPPSRINSAQTTAEYVDAEDIWVSPPSTSRSSSRRSSRIVIPPVFPPRRGYRRLFSTMRKAFARTLKPFKRKSASMPTMEVAPVDADDGSRFQVIRFRPSRQPLSTSGSSHHQPLDTETDQGMNSTPHDTTISTTRGRSRTRRPIASVLGVDSSPDVSINRQPVLVPLATSSTDTTAFQYPATRLSSQIATRATTPRICSQEHFLVFELFGDLAFIDTNNTYQETVRLARRAFPSLQTVDDNRIHFHLPCGPLPNDRARIPEDAWVNLIRRVSPAERVYINIAHSCCVTKRDRSIQCDDGENT